MEVVGTQLAQSMIAVRANRSLGYLPDAVTAAVKEYGFIEYPQHAHEFFPADPNQAITFRHGKIALEGKTIVIGWLQIYQSGLSVSTDTNTSESDLALTHVLRWATAQFEVNFEVIRPVGHLSQLEVRFERRLGDLVPFLKPVSDRISQGIDKFFPIRPSYELTSLTFHFDPTANPSVAPAAVKIEPRLSVPFEDNVYFSEAPLSTDTHKEVLEQFERACMGR